MLRHVVLLTLDGSADAAGIASSLRRLPDLIDQIRAYEVLADAGLADGNAHIAVIGTFDDADAWRAYVEHPEHQAVLQQQIRPHLVSRSALQSEV